MRPSDSLLANAIKTKCQLYQLLSVKLEMKQSLRDACSICVDNDMNNHLDLCSTFSMKDLKSSHRSYSHNSPE